MYKNIEIKISKTKSIFSLVGCIAFVLVSIWFIYSPNDFVNWKNRSESFIFFIGIIGVITFSFFGYFIINKLFDTKKGLVITEDGIIDNSSAISIGKIHWKDIEKIEVHSVAETKFLILITKNPQKYIDSEQNKIIKRVIKANYNLYGSPITISSNSLQISFSKLEKLIISEFENFKNKNVV